VKPLKRLKSASKLFKSTKNTATLVAICNLSQEGSDPAEDIKFHLAHDKKKVKMEDDMFETNSDVGQITNEDFEMMHDIISPTSDDKEPPEERKSDTESSPLSSPSKFGSDVFSTRISMEGLLNPVTSAFCTNTVTGQVNSISPSLKKSLKNNKKKYKKSHSVYLKGSDNENS